MRKFVLGSILATSVILASPYTFARDQISIVGSSTVYPFATVVAERFGKSTSFSVPKIESTGSGGGLKLFCAGVGENSPDITNASRKIKESEIDLCKQNGVSEIVEIKIGYDGIAFANSINSPQMDVSIQELYMALAKVLPNENGNLS
nr:substrate-binding domain-containing protein [uncultured Vibrio sp.]